MIERLLRLVAVAIAIAGVVDPSWTLERPVAPVVALHVGPGAEALGDRVRRAVGDEFVLAPAPVSGADARIVTGRGLPPATDAPTFVIVEEAGVEILDVRAPARSPASARVPVQVTLDVGGAVLQAGRADAPDGPVVRLLVGGLLADEVPVAAFTPLPGGLATASMTFIPAGAAPQHLRVSIGEEYVDALVGIDDAPWRVLAHDPRPSWSATFVRRALERDPRFAVAARVDTSPQSRVASGESVDRDGIAVLEAIDLGGLAGLEAEAIDVIVVGAPDALDAATVETLADFLRRRGGSVVMLIDREPGAVAELAGSVAWSERLSPSPSLLRDADALAVLQASEMAIPGLLPAAGQTLAGIGEGAALQPVVWRMPVGRGRLVVSGALDAWRFRAADEARFDRFWRGVVADAAAAAAAPLELDVGFRVGRPGQRLPVAVTVRDLALDPAGAGTVRVSARLEPASRPASRQPATGGEGESSVIRLWPAEPGNFRGTASFPQSPGAYRLVVEGAGASAAVDLLVRDDAVPPPAVSSARRAAWAAAQGGAVIGAARIGELPDAIRGSVTIERVAVVVQPMRSSWWLVAFALVLAGEWCLRRRRGAR